MAASPVVLRLQVWGMVLVGAGSRLRGGGGKRRAYE